MLKNISFPVRLVKRKGAYERFDYKDTDGAEHLPDAIIAAANNEIETMRAQIAALTPTAEQVKRRELGELALAAREASDTYTEDFYTLTADQRVKLFAAYAAADLAYIAARDAAKGGAA